jgi:hypoxanthine-DNA glycosylase
MTDSIKLEGLPPRVTADTRVLVLGSFPSAASLAAGRYYAHPRNQFWKLVGAAIGRALDELDYEQRVIELNQMGIGLWDVIGRCRRRGSLDGNIREPEYNDFAALAARCPHLELACFNGKTAARHIAHLQAHGLATRVLPSSSPANTQPVSEKLNAWTQALSTAQFP